MPGGSGSPVWAGAGRADLGGYMDRGQGAGADAGQGDDGGVAFHGVEFGIGAAGGGEQQSVVGEVLQD
jgi:hypothetical protein